MLLPHFEISHCETALVSTQVWEWLSPFSMQEYHNYSHEHSCFPSQLQLTNKCEKGKSCYFEAIFQQNRKNTNLYFTLLYSD